MTSRQTIELAIVAGLALSACSASSISVDSFSRPVNGPAGGYEYSLDLDLSGTGRPETSILDGTDPGIAISSGTGQFSGFYSMAWANRGDDEVLLLTGPVALNVNFGTGTFASTSGTLPMNGTVSGTTMDGTVTFRGQPGDLDGLIGTRQAVGVFQSTGSNIFFAGGFIAAPAP